MDDRQRAGEQVPRDGDRGAGVTARDLVVDAGVRDDVVAGDLAGLGDDEAVSELGVGGGEPEPAGVGLEAVERCLAAEGLVWLPVVLVVEVVGQPQLERATIVVDVCSADDSAQDLGLRGLIEFSILPWPSGYPAVPSTR